MNCYYCNDKEKLDSLMLKICDLRTSTLYLFKDQKHRGKCILVFNQHKTEIFQLTELEKQNFMSDISDAAEAIYNIYNPDKINYAIYGDIVSHLHVHLTPKYINGPEWGMAFKDSIEPIKLSDYEYNENILKIKNFLLNNIK